MEFSALIPRNPEHVRRFDQVLLGLLCLLNLQLVWRLLFSGSGEYFSPIWSRCSNPSGSDRTFEMSCPPHKIRFATLADYGVQHGSGATAAIANSLLAKRSELDFIVTGGDNFYERGVHDVDDDQWQSTWFDRYQVSSLNLLWFPVLGNHDHYGNAQAQVEFTTSNEQGAKYWFLPANYYTVTLKMGFRKLQFIMLDTEKFSREQQEWLDTQLTAASSSYKVVFGHHHVFSHGFRGDNGGMKHLASKFSDAGVKHYICGHEHDMQYLTHQGVNYFLVGGGGAGLRRPKHRSRAEQVYYSTNHGMSVHEIDLQAGTMKTWLEIYDRNGYQLDVQMFQTTL